MAPTPHPANRLRRLPRALPDPAWRALLAGAALYLALRPLLGLGHELAVAAVACTLHALVASGLWQPAVAWLGVDPIYTSAALRAAGGVQVQGLAVVGPVGDWLHSLWPGLFLPPDLVVGGAWASMVAAPGTPALGHGLAAFGADVLWLAAGLWAFRRGRGPLATAGLLLQAHIVLHRLLQARIGIPDLEASGLPFAVALLQPAGDPWWTAWLAQRPGFWQQAIIGGALVALAYACALLLLAIGRLPAPAARAVAPRHPARPPRPAPPRLSRSAGLILALATAVSPVGAVAVGASNWRGQVSPSRATGATGAPRCQPRPDAPSAVRVERPPGGGWRYLVDGCPAVIRGVGYNPQYASLPPAERARLYDRDFAAMRQLGINTIEGWFEPQFDEVTLAAAERNGIGVLMPFELNQDWDYADPALQARLLERVSAWVERYKRQPALRLWAPGNEDLHRILSPHWSSQEHVPAVRARADAFAAFLPRLVDRIHQLDPDHPVVYRDAEDVYLPRLKAAFERTGVARPWLVYGANVYSATRLYDIVAGWPGQWLDGPLLISEFAPSGLGPAERPQGYAEEWVRIRERPDVVFGGLAYTWATNGPEELDRVFGLVDADGRPVDGALAALGGAYTGELAPAAPSR